MPYNYEAVMKPHEELIEYMRTAINDYEGASDEVDAAVTRPDRPTAEQLKQWQEVEHNKCAALEAALWDMSISHAKRCPLSHEIGPD